MRLIKSIFPVSSAKIEDLHVAQCCLMVIIICNTILDKDNTILQKHILQFVVVVVVLCV